MRDNLDGSPLEYTQPYSDSAYAGPFDYPLANPEWVKNPIAIPDWSAGLPPSSLPLLKRVNPFVLRLLVLLVILFLAQQVGGGSYFIFFGGVWFWFQFLLIPFVKLVRRYYYDLSEAVAVAAGPAAAFVSSPLEVVSNVA
jgi:hypothetical protein